MFSRSNVSEGSGTGLETLALIQHILKTSSPENITKCKQNLVLLTDHILTVLIIGLLLHSLHKISSNLTKIYLFSIT